MQYVNHVTHNLSAHLTSTLRNEDADVHCLQSNLIRTYSFSNRMKISNVIFVYKFEEMQMFVKIAFEIINLKNMSLSMGP